MLEMKLGAPSLQSWGNKRKPAKDSRKWPVTQEETQRQCTMVPRKHYYLETKDWSKACISFSFIEYIYGLSGLPEEDYKRPWHKPQHLLFQSWCDCGQHDRMEAPAYHQTIGEMDAKKCGVCVDFSTSFPMLGTKLLNFLCIAQELEIFHRHLGPDFLRGTVEKEWGQQMKINSQMICQREVRYCRIPCHTNIFF